MKWQKKVDISSRGGRAEDRTRAYIVPAVDRAAQILSLLKAEGTQMTIAEIAGATGWHKSSVHKLLVTLHYRGLLDRDAITKKYSLGIALSEYGRIALNRSDILHAARSFLNALADFSGETAALSVLRGTKMIIVDTEESPTQLRAAPTIGMRTPATTTSNGKAVLAFLPEDRLKEILRVEGLPAMTENSIVKLGAFRVDLAATRERGYAIDNEEYQKGLVGVSAPVLDSRKQVMGALSVVGPAVRMTKDKIRQYGRKCAEMTAELSAMLR
jgi:IclR family acetate operon transcriptional repressor